MTSPTASPRPTPLSRRLLAAVLTCVPALLLLTWGRAQLSGLPEQIPTHFGGNGYADDWSSRNGTWLALMITTAVLALAGIAAVWVRRDGVRVWLLIGIGWLASLLFGIWWATVVVTHAASEAGQERLGWELAVWLVGAVVWAGVVYLGHGRAERIPAAGVASARALPLVPGERVASRAVVTSRMFWVLGIVLVAVAAGTVVAMALTDAGWPLTAFVGVLLVLSSGAGLALARATVTADARGLRVTSWLGFPIKRIAPDAIASVRAEEIEPTEWGGWGYRMLPGRSAFILRRGLAVVVVLTTGREFAVTTDDAEELAEVLAALSQRSATAG